MKTGGLCLLIGTLAFATARLLHGDTPAADADAALTFVAGRSTYTAVHIVAVLGATTIAIGLTALASSLTSGLRPGYWVALEPRRQSSAPPSSVWRARAKGWRCPSWSAAQADPG